MPEQTELTVSYSIGTKVNLGNYESADVHLSETERWDVRGMSPLEIDQFATDRYLSLHSKLGERVIEEKNEMLGT